MLPVMPRVVLLSATAQESFVTLFGLGGQLMSVLPMSSSVYDPDTRNQNQETAGNTVFRYKLAQTCDSNSLQVTAFRTITTSLFSTEKKKKNYIFTRSSIPGG